MIPDPLKDWYLATNKQHELEAALNLPIMKEAMALLTFISLPKPEYSTKGSAETITDAAMEQKRNAGFFSYPDHMWQLTEKPAEPPKAPEGYSDSYVKAWMQSHGYSDYFPEEQEQPATTNQ